MSALICETCGLPQELCVCEDVATTTTGDLKIDTEARRYGKLVTVISGFQDGVALDDLASELKSSFGCGGTVDGDTIELQGDHVDRAIHELTDRGFTLTA